MDKPTLDRASRGDEPASGATPTNPPDARAAGVPPPTAGVRRHAAEEALRRADRRVLRRTEALYLNGAALDRGALRLTSHSLRFDGWQGSVVIPIQEIADVRLGTSVLPRHAGIPVLSWLWPGKPRYAESLLLTVRNGAESESRIATVAGLKDGGLWRDEILRCREAYGDWSRERAQRVAELEAAECAPTPGAAAAHGAAGSTTVDAPSAPPTPGESTGRHD